MALNFFVDVEARTFKAFPQLAHVRLALPTDFISKHFELGFQDLGGFADLARENLFLQGSN